MVIPLARFISKSVQLKTKTTCHVEPLSAPPAAPPSKCQKIQNAKLKKALLRKAKTYPCTETEKALPWRLCCHLAVKGPGDPERASIKSDMKKQKDIRQNQ